MSPASVIFDGGDFSPGGQVVDPRGGPTVGTKDWPIALELAVAVGRKTDEFNFHRRKKSL
jgi:hypothetical protein